MYSQRILIVRPGALGDTILTIPLIHTIHRMHPSAHVTFLGTGRYRDVVPGFIEFHDFDAPEWLWLFQPDGKEVSSPRGSFDLAYVVLSNPEDVTRNLLQAGTGTVKEATPRPPEGNPLVPYLHRSLGLPEPRREPALGRVPGGKFPDAIWVHPGSGGPSKCLPISTMLTLVSELKALTGYRTVATMSEEDAFLTALPGWNSLVSDPATVVLKDLPLKELCESMGSARLFLGNDSGISHLAAALGVPAIVLFVRTDPAIWSPWTEPSLLHVVDLRDKDPATMDVKQALLNMREFVRSAANRI